MNRPIAFRWLAAIAVLFAALATPLQAVANAYTVSIDTSALSGTNAVVAFQFDPGVDSPAATATLDAFAGASSAGPSESFGAASGALFPAGPLVLQNTPTLNLFLQPLTLGTSFSFSLSFTGNVPPGPDASFFGLSVVDNTTDFNPLLTEDPQGFLLTVDLFPGQAPEISNLSPTFVTIAVVPEPGTYALMLAGLLMLVAGVRGLGFQSRRRLDNSSLRYA